MPYDISKLEELNFNNLVIEELNSLGYTIIKHNIFWYGSSNDLIINVIGPRSIYVVTHDNCVALFGHELHGSDFCYYFVDMTKACFSASMYDGKSYDELISQIPRCMEIKCISCQYANKHTI